MASKADRERVAIELKKWLRSQAQYKTIAELERPTGISYSSLKDYFQGRALPSNDRLEKLATLTNIPSLLALLPAPRRTAASGDSSSTEKAQAVLHAVHRLLNELDSFKRGTPEDRALLRSIVPPRDVGYLTTLLRAMYDEDQFQAWLYFAEYKPGPR